MKVSLTKTTWKIRITKAIRPPKENERYFALLRVEAVNYQDPNLAASKIPFDELTPLHPEQRIIMEWDDHDNALKTTKRGLAESTNYRNPRNSSWRYVEVPQK